MDTAFILFWTAMIWGSIAWYSYLLVHVGWRGGRDILRMTHRLRQENGTDDSP